jgi:hypothetical protein
VTEIIESGDAVFEFQVTADTPGNCLRRATIKQLSGKPLAEAQRRNLISIVRKRIEALGGKCHQVAFDREGRG